MDIKQEVEYGFKFLKENNIDEAMLKVKILLGFILKQNKEYLVTHYDEKVSFRKNKEFNNCLERLINNEPLQYIIGKQEFMGLDFIVNEDVLIPRQDTEILVEEVINIMEKEQKTRVLDLCTGSGAIGISIAKYIDKAKITLADISKKALEIAKENAITNNENEKIEIIESDLFSELNEQNKFDIIVSNPPYIKSEIIKTLEKQVQKEPIIALDGGTDGLDIYRRIIKEGYKYLEDAGYLCLEIGYDQKQDVTELINKSIKYQSVYSKKDLSGNDRIIICKKEEK